MLKSNGHGNLMPLGWPRRFMLSYDFISTLNADFKERIAWSKSDLAFTEYSNDVNLDQLK